MGIQQGDKIVHFDKYNLYSPSVDSITQTSSRFLLTYKESNLIPGITNWN